MTAVLPKMDCILGGLNMSADEKGKEIDLDWLKLIKEAKEIGISIEEIREFLHRQTIKNK